MKIELKNFGKALENTIAEMTTKHIQEVTRSVVCEVHLRSPNITVRGPSLNNLSYEVSGLLRTPYRENKEKTF